MENEIELNYDQLQISSDDDDKADSIYKQEYLLSELINRMTVQNEGINLFDKISQMIEMNRETETKFEHQFRGTQWPMHRIAY